jgi:glutathione S-transferase
VPLYDLARERVDVFQFVDKALSPKVEFGFHAMSIDELRSDFPVTEWTPRVGVEQVWFAGAHADVGGGYPMNYGSGNTYRSNNHLAFVALVDMFHLSRQRGVMMRKLDDKGVQFAKPVPFPPQRCIGTERVHEPWQEVPFLARRRKAREVSTQGTLHGSVVNRIAKTPEYAPESMKSARAHQAIGSFAVDNAVW